MRPAGSVVSRAETRFGQEELFFSTTDRKGIITSGNEVFMRVAGYALEEMVGKAHNLVRHPDMPRAAFKLLWEHLESERPFAAYVKNRSSDGSYYWVMAAVVPLAGQYLSVRLKPSTDFFAAAQSIYSEARALELGIERDNPRLRKQAIEQSKQLVLARLREAGFASYAEFMHSALPAEVSAREAALGSAHRAALCRVPWDADTTLAKILGACGGMHDFVAKLLDNVEHYAALNRTLPQKAAFVLDLAEEVRLFALNARLAATRLEGSGATLAAIAALMRERSDAAGPLIGELSVHIVGTVELLGDIGFRIAATKLQAEMLLLFIQELLTGRSADARMAIDLATLAEGLGDGVERMFASLSKLDDGLSTMSSRVNVLGSELGVIQALEMNGRIEATRVPEATSIRVLFQTIGKHVRLARQELSEFQGMGKATANARDGSQRRMLSQLDSVRGRVEELRAATSLA